MNKRVIILLLALAGLGAGAVPAAGAMAPRASLRSLVCHHALDPGARKFAITAVMRPLTGTRKLELSFQLQSRAPGGRYTTIRSGDLGTWISPKDPTLGQLPGDTWIVTKQVFPLAAPAHYRFKVSFRWLGAHKRILGTTTLQSPSCWQPELRPDLSVDSIVVSPDPYNPNRDRYTVAIHNRGATRAGAFPVQFAPGGTATPLERTLPGLAAHWIVRIVFRGPLCNPASPPIVTVDPNQVIDDYNRENNSLTAVCPAP